MIEEEAQAAAKAFAEKHGLSKEVEAELAELLKSTWDDGFDAVATGEL